MNSHPENGKSNDESGLESITDFALGELDDEQRAAIAEKMRLDPHCEELARHHSALAKQLKQCLASEASASSAPTVRKSILEHLDQKENEAKFDKDKEPIMVARRQDWNWRRVGKYATVAGCLLFLVAVVTPAGPFALQKLAQYESSDQSYESASSETKADYSPDTLGPSLSLATDGNVIAPRADANSSQSDRSSSTLPPPTGDAESQVDFMRSNLGSTPATVSSISSADITLPARTIPATIHVPDGGAVMAGGIRLDSSVESWRLYAADQDGVAPQGYFREGSMTRQSSEQYESPPENPFTPVVDFQALSTFAIDVDTASYANIRRFINSGTRPPADAVRIEEMINYFSYEDAAPSENQPFSVHSQIASCPWSPAHRLLRVALKGKEIPRDDRPLSNLVFLVDVSGSMQSQDKLPLLKQSLLLLTDQLTENDQISIVTYAGNAGLKLPSTNGTDKQTIRDAIRSLQSGGSTHGSAGIKLAYEIARQNMIEGGVNRVLLATDGDLNVGITADESLVDLITEEASGGVFLTVLGFGTGNLKDAKLEKIADHGNGVYAYLDSMREARKVLLEQMSASLVTIAKDVKIQIEFNPQHVREYRLIGYENRVMAAEDFRNDAKDAGEIGAGHSVVALYEIVPQSAPQARDAPVEQPSLRYQTTEPESSPVEESEPRKYSILTDEAGTDEWLYVRLRYKQPDGNEATEIGHAVTDEGTSLNRAGTDFQFAAAVASFGMLLKNSQYAGSTTFSMIEEIAAGALGDDPNGHRTEFLDLVRKANSVR